MNLLFANLNSTGDWGVGPSESQRKKLLRAIFAKNYDEVVRVIARYNMDENWKQPGLYNDGYGSNGFPHASIASAAQFLVHSIWARNPSMRIVELLIQKCDRRIFTLRLSSDGGGRRDVPECVYREGYFGITPVEAAAYWNHPNVIDLFLQNGLCGSDALGYSLGREGKPNLPMCKWLIESRNVDVNTIHESLEPRTGEFFGPPIVELIAGSRLSDCETKEMIDYLLEKNADINLAAPKELTPLLCAVYWKSLPLYEFLLSRGAHIEDEDLVLSEAIWANDPKMIKYFVNTHENGPVFLAACRKTAVARVIHCRCCDWTPNVAAQIENKRVLLDLMQYFVDAGYDVDSRLTPIMVGDCEGEL